IRTDPGRAGTAMERVRDTGRGAMTEMRRMLDVLRDGDTAPRAPQPGLVDLEQLLDDTRATGLRVDLTVTGAPVTLPAGPDLAAYRLVQEALTNARKHGGPLLSVVSVTLGYRDAEIDLRIVDDGADAAPPASAGHGLAGMRERVAAYGGSVEAGPRAGGGVDVHAVLPTGGEAWRGTSARHRRSAWFWSTTRRCTGRGSGCCWSPAPGSRWSGTPTTGTPPSTSWAPSTPTSCSWTCGCPGWTASRPPAASARRAAPAFSS